MSTERWIDAAIGETREALVRDGRIVALRVLRDSGEGRRARWGELYAARIASVDKRRRGAFVDLGLADEQGFLPLSADGRARRGRENVAPREGERVVVSVTREAARTKSPVVALAAEAHPGGASTLLHRHEGDEELANVPPLELQKRAQIDAAIDDALARTAPLSGGGLLTIEPTAALVAIDVDAGARAGAGDPERFALDLNVAAAEEAARQLRLRALAGIVAIDFVSMRHAQSRSTLLAAVKAAFAGDPWSVQLGQLSRFGVLELSRAQLTRPLHEIMCDPDGRLSVETLALSALRAIEREARAQSGRRIVAGVSPDVHAWLETTRVDWRAALTGRIGMRYTLETLPGAQRDRIDVRAP